MKQNASTELPDYSFHNIYNKDGPAGPIDPLIALVPGFSGLSIIIKPFFVLPFSNVLLVNPVFADGILLVGRLSTFCFAL